MPYKWKIIFTKKSYLKLELFIIVIYLKVYNCMQTNNNYFF